MNKYLIDVNLPYRYRLWHKKNSLHVRDLDDTLPDSEIWQYAIDNDYIIVTKDTDFSDRILLMAPPPRVVHIKFGNMKLKDFYDKMNSVWWQIDELTCSYKLIRVFSDRIECVE